MTDTAEVATLPSPYPGLRSFSENEAEFFFGRDHERDVIIARLKASRLTVLYGPSGVGKSSLLRAAVMKSLNDQAVARRSRLGTPEFIPVIFSAWQDRPDRALADEIAKAAARVTGSPVEPAANLVETVASTARLARATPLLVLDQFEDVLRPDGAPNGDAVFAAQFPRLITDKSMRVHVLVSIREDALALLDRFRAEVPWLLETRVRVRPLSDEAAVRAIRGPLETYEKLVGAQAAVSVDDELVSAVLNQVRSGRVGFEQDGHAPPINGDAPHGRPTRVDTPYLQLVMETVWNREMALGSRELRLSTFEKLGGAQGIVSGHLDNVLGNLDDSDRQLAVDVFDRLVTPSGTRIVMTVPDLAEISHQSVEQVERFIGRLERDQRILREVPAPPSAPGPPGVEVFHDVLAPGILAWRRGQVAQRLWREKRTAERRARVFGAVAVAAVTLAVIAIGAVIYALSKRDQADRARRTAEAGQLATESGVNFQGGLLGLGTLLAIEAYRTAPSSQARDALMRALVSTQPMQAYLTHQTGAISSVAFAPGSRTLASASADGTVLVWDIRHGQPLHVIHADTSYVESVAFSSDGTLLASAGYDGTIAVWRAATGRPLWSKSAAAGPVYSVAFAPSGNLLASAGADGAVTLWSAATGRPLGRLVPGRGAIYRVAFDRTGSLLATADSDGTASVWGVARRRRLRLLRAPAKPLQSVAFSPRDETLAGAGSGSAIAVWNAQTGKRVQTLLEKSSAVEAVAFDPSGSMLASANYDDSVAVWSLRSGRPVQAFSGHAAPVDAVAFSPDGQTLASGGDDKALILWNASPSVPREIAAGQPVYGVATARSGPWVAWGGPRGAAIVNTATGATRSLPAGPTQAVELSPDGQVLATGGNAGSVLLWNPSTGVLERRLSAGTKPIYGVAFGPGGEILAAASGDGAVTVWNAQTGAPERTLRVDHSQLNAVAVSADGSMIAAAGSDATVLVWDLSSGRLLHRLTGHTAPIEALAFSPRGDTLASAGNDRTVFLWDAKSGDQLGDPMRAQLGWVTGLAFSPDGRTVVSSSLDGTVIAWNVATRLGRPLGPPSGTLTSVAFGSGHNMVLAGNGDDVVDAFSAIPPLGGPNPIYDRLCGVVRGNLSRAQWHEFVPGMSYHRICPGFA